MKIIFIFVLLKLICVTSNWFKKNHFNCTHYGCNNIVPNCEKGNLHAGNYTCDFDGSNQILRNHEYLIIYYGNYLICDHYQDNEWNCSYIFDMDNDTDRNKNSSENKCVYWRICNVELNDEICHINGQSCCEISGTCFSGEITTNGRDIGNKPVTLSTTVASSTTVALSTTVVSSTTVAPTTTAAPTTTVALSTTVASKTVASSTTVASTTVASSTTAASSTCELASVTTLLLLSVMVVLVFGTANIIYCLLRNKRTKNKGDFRIQTRNTGPNIANLELTDRTNTMGTHLENSTQDREYCTIENENTIETKSNTNQMQDNSPQYGLIINELYAGFVEGEVADVKLYEELSQLNNQISPTYSIVNNPLYNVSLRHKSESQISNYYIEPSGSLPELEYSLKCCPFEIKIGELEIGEQFASGHFGVVYRATYHTVRGDIPVAVKTLKESSNSDTKVSFMTEAATLAQFSHPNVLRLIGVITVQQPWMIVTELLKTELRELLIKLKGFPQNQILPNLLFKFSQEIAEGMEYLSGIHFIHRDLAARNVLVAKDLTIRVADFGMSREVISENDYYTSSGGTVPLRWTAPEAVLYKKYSEKSDVWSYGMTLYEIWTLGDKPWGNSTNQEIIEAMTIGQSPPPPSDCPQGLCSVMQKCWRADKTDRPTFSEIINFLSGVSIPVISPTN